MSCKLIQTENRDIPLRQPANWKVKFPRWMLELPQDVNELFITYIGVQPGAGPLKGTFTDLKSHKTSRAQRQVAAEIERWILEDSGASAPLLWEKFYVETGYDIPDTEVWVLYWTDKLAEEEALASLDLHALSQSVGSSVGLWRESYRVPKTRFETVYSGNDYQPGIASLNGAEQVTHKFTGYWGAARDRIPCSAKSTLSPENPAPVPDYHKASKGKVFKGSNRDVLLHIRSGQWWARCPPEERRAYEENLEPVLRKGMAYLEDNARESGDFGLRFMRQLVSNVTVRHDEEDKSSEESHSDAGTDSSDAESMTAPSRRMETCSAGFFRSLKDLEHWAAKHPTHHKIFHGAHAHSTKFGKETFKMRTWHEVAVLKPGEVTYEYVNCEPRTGLIPFVDMQDAS
jgi:hypothetical protein